MHIHTYIHTHIYLWTQESDKSWDGHGRDLYPRALSPGRPLPQSGYFPFSRGRSPYSAGPPHGQERGDRAIGNIAITLCGRGFSPLLSAVVFQLSLRGTQYSCLTASFLRCRLNEKKKKPHKTKHNTKTNKTPKQNKQTKNPQRKWQHRKQHNKKTTHGNYFKWLLPFLERLCLTFCPACHSWGPLLWEKSCLMKCCNLGNHKFI